ncbi:MAG: SURF1 family protein [Rickettsiales bacterium]|jgi:surfeit locus 1 family protein|nr:SURF1 family protein [Rickettsiales bacterium]
MTKDTANNKKLIFIGFSLCITALVFYLGIWQTSRHFEKKAIIENYKTQIDKPIEVMKALDLHDPIANKFQIYKTKAQFIPHSEILLGPKQIDKIVGYNVIGLFKTTLKQNIVINLGFIPLDKKGNLNINTNFQQLTLIQYKFRNRPNIFIPKNDPKSLKWFYLDRSSLEQHYDTELTDIYFGLLSNNFSPDIKPLDKHDANFFNEHFNYAITWFTLSVILVIMIIIYTRIEKVRFTK